MSRTLGVKEKKFRLTYERIHVAGILVVKGKTVELIAKTSDEAINTLARQVREKHGPYALLVDITVDEI